MKVLRKWLANFFIRSKSPIPPLPDEILLNIFEYLTPDERLPLCLVCKKFRLLELQIGNRKFDSVFCLMLDDDETLNTALSDVLVGQMHSAYSYSFATKANGDFETTTPGISKFFKGATADNLYFVVSRNREPIVSQYLYSILDKIAVKEMLYLFLECKSDFLDFIIRFFDYFKNEHLKKITFTSHSLNDQNLARLDEAMQRLPKLEFLSMHKHKKSEQIIVNDMDNFLLNGPLMLALIRTAPQLMLHLIHCTAQDLLDAFTIICKSGVHKYAVLFVVASAAENLFALAEEQGLVTEGIYVIDLARGYCMFAYESIDEGCRRVDIRRMDEDGCPIF